MCPSHKRGKPRRVCLACAGAAARRGQRGVCGATVAQAVVRFRACVVVITAAGATARARGLRPAALMLYTSSVLFRGENFLLRGDILLMPCKLLRLRRGGCPQCADGCGKVRCTAIGQVVARNRGNNHVRKPKGLRCLCHARRLVRVWR